MNWYPICGRDGNGADRDRIMGDPNPPRTCTTNTRPRPAPHRPIPPRELGYRALTRPQSHASRDSPEP